MNQEAYSLIEGVLSQKRQAPHAVNSLTGSDFDRMTPEECLAKSRVTASTLLSPMEPLLRLYGVPCLYRGELVAVCGKAKSGKTLFLSMMMACCLSRKVLALERHTETTDPTDGCSGSLRSKSEENLEENLSKDATDMEPLRVLWIDTEQSQQSTQDIMVNRIIPLVRGHTESDVGGHAETTEITDSSNPAVGDIDACLFAYNLRGMGFEKRRELVKAAIELVEADLVVIDGIKDLMTDINDAVQATAIIEQLMALAQHHRCCMVCVLHQNKSEADHNMRGSIGTELTNKAFEVYSCEYIADSDAFKVSQRLSRRDHIKRKLYYRLDDKGLPVDCEEPLEQPRDGNGRWTKVPRAAERGLSCEQLRKLFTDAMEGRTQRPFGQLMAVALKRCGVVDAQSYYGYVKEAEELGIIHKVAHPETGVTWVELADSELPF